ncbi:MAG: cytidylate kinase-like family protein [Anaerolineales bacterium]
MTGITISRQLGSLGTSVGRLVAGRLDYSLVHREIINQAGHITGSPDIALAVIDELGLFGLAPDESQYQAYLQAVNQVMQTLVAQQNVVIVGRAGQVILRGRTDVLHVRVIAPLEVRIERVMRAHGISRSAAQAQIVESDRYRARYLQRFYDAQWDDPALYHLIVNTGLMSLAQAADTICAAVYSMTLHAPSEEVTLG